MIMASATANERIIPTLDSLTPGQIDAIRRIPPHEAARPIPMNVTRPTSIFLNEERYVLEQDRIFRRLPVPVMLSAALTPGVAIANEAYGVSLILTRTKDGVARAFLNTCQHKGSKILEDELPHKAPRLVCPFHAWTYGLDGELVGVPRQEVFSDFCKANHRLAQLPCRDAGGFIWVQLDRNSAEDFSTLDGEIVADLEALNLHRMHVYHQQSFDLKANWKLVLEPFMEPYHVQRLHAKSVAPLFADVPSVVDMLGHHIRIITGKVQFEPEVLDDPAANIHKTVTHAYIVFPNISIITSPYYISVMIVVPQGVDRSRVEYSMLTREPPDNPKAEQLFADSLRIVLGVFGNEDFRAAVISQAGLAAGGLDKMTYGGLEDVIPQYYQVLESELG
jgi:phenylpropionate dioxygenase-like ring-hydroxylating dioxygenase large terminal subunit